MTADPRADALARLYDLDLSEDPGDVDLYVALADRGDGPIVELAVGTGRIAVPLAAAGHGVVGVDLDPAMLARAAVRARESGPGAVQRLALVGGDLVEVEVPGQGGFGLAILGLNSILLLAERGRQRRALRRMFDLLEPAGIAVIDTWLPGAEDLVRFDGRVSLEWLRTDPQTGREVAKLAAAWYDAGSRLVTLTTIFDEAEPGSPPIRWTRSDALRLIGPDELEDHATDAGFEVESLAGDYDLSPFGPGSDRAILILRRPG
ncbi:MAG TPA: class I SAM-dependent methyltransferase [Candidatus Limnocylindrales bacterium]|nr:class I SAM-dependent methyltransferase [Candidatus Limnocylindrales bacterium]